MAVTIWLAKLRRKGKHFKKPGRNSPSPLESWENNIHFSFSSRKWRTLFQISLSLLRTGEKNFRFLFLFSKLEILKKILFLLSKLEKRKSLSLSLLESGEPFFKFLFLLSKLGKWISGFSFSSRKWRKEYQISLSLLGWTFWPLVNDWVGHHLIIFLSLRIHFF